MANHMFYEKKRWSDLHMTVLDDDGIARIAEKLESLKTRVDEIVSDKEGMSMLSPNKV